VHQLREGDDLAPSSTRASSAPAPLFPKQPIPIAAALRRVFSKGYGPAEIRADLLAGIVVGIVALPLSMALAIAVGVPPQHGLYTAIVAGCVIALLGGCKFQVTGPTAAFIVILAPIVTKFGLGGLLTAGLMAGIMLVGMGIARLGRLIQFIPHPVTTGFTSGIGVVIATLQIKDIFGLDIRAMPDSYIEKVVTLWHARGTARIAELGVAAATFALLRLIPRFIKRVPAPLIAIGIVSIAAAVVHQLDPAFEVATIGSRFHTKVNGVDIAGIPPVLPAPSWPWGSGGLSFGMLRELVPSAFAIAMLGAIESLLSAVIADGMTGTKHEPNSELVALGIGNIVAPFFGGIAATGALARTATNIRAGARSPFASVMHAVVVLLSMVLLARWVAFVPMASLAALLLQVAWNMSEVRNFAGVVRVAPKSDVAVLLTCFGLTVLFDMVVAVSIGVVLAAMLFMRRMAELTEARSILEPQMESEHERLPKGVALYEINGPLFFGAAQKAMDALSTSRSDTYKVLILHLGKVPVIDATGLVALENAIQSQIRRKKTVVLAGPLPRPREMWVKANLREKFHGLEIASTLEHAKERAESLVA
jgi:SulP family sulfate permease